MPSRNGGSPIRWLLRKEWRELLVSRSWWLLLVLMGPLTGVSFLSAMRTYAELSSGGGGDILSPLIGVWAPTFSGCELAAVFLLPFVAIRIVGADRQSGAMKLELQSGLSPFQRIGAKALVALAGWMVAMLPAALAIALWKAYGGNVHVPELTVLVAGHVLNGLLTIALGAASASIAEHPSTAAILTLGVTVGTWIVSFIAAVQGGLWERLAAFTPPAIIADFQHGLLRLDTLLAALILIASGLGIASIWQRTGVRAFRRAVESAVVVASAAMAIALTAQVRPSWDLSENRINSFPKADEQALRSIEGPLRIVVHLAPEDSRRSDLERRSFSKLRRVVRDLRIDYVSATSTGIFEQNREGYGEISYEWNGRKETNRVTTVDGVLESIYKIAKLQLPGGVPEAPFRGHPLDVQPHGAAALFYGVWPGAILATGVFIRRRFHHQ